MPDELILEYEQDCDQLNLKEDIDVFDLMQKICNLFEKCLNVSGIYFSYHNSRHRLKRIKPVFFRMNL